MAPIGPTMTEINKLGQDHVTQSSPIITTLKGNQSDQWAIEQI